MRITTIVAMLLATTSTVALAQTVTANGNTGRVNNGTTSTASDIHNREGSTVLHSPKRKAGQSAESAKKQSEKLIHASGSPDSRSKTEGSRGSSTNGVVGTPDPESNTTVPGTNR